MIELLQFRHSPYNDKVRWALDLKRVPHRRRSLLPGPHAATLRRLAGRTHTPTIVDGRPPLRRLAYAIAVPPAGPLPYGAAFAALLGRFESQPAIAWTRQPYARHRGASRDFDGRCGGSER